MGSRICGTCRKKLVKVPDVPDCALDAETDSSSSTRSDSPSEILCSPSEAIQVVNQCLVDLGETPVTKRKLQSKKYSETKLEALTTKLSDVMLVEKHNDESEILQQLKEKFHSTS
jgi:hypothetical protein